MNCLACETEQPGGGCLCPECAERLDRQLAELPGLYEQLGDFLERPVRPSAGRSCPSPDAPIPVDETVLDMVGPGGIVAVLESWRQALCADVGRACPEPFGTYRGRLLRAVRALRADLELIRYDWPQAGLFAGEVRQLLASVRSVVAPPVQTIRAGLCQTELEDGTVCGAVIRTTMRNPEVKCAWCGTTWPASTWLKLAQAKLDAA